MGRKQNRFKRRSEFMSNEKFIESGVLNVNYEAFYYERLKELAISIFEWQNLPDSVDERFLELTLFENGSSIFFIDEVLGYLALCNSSGGNYDVYGYPAKRRAYARNGYSKDLNENDSVIIYNNQLRTNSEMDIRIFARKLAHIDRMIDVNTNAQKTPILITCDESQLLSFKNMYMKYDGNQPVIFGDKNLTRDSFKALNTTAPYNSDKLYELKTQVWNEALTYLGISNINVTKKERLITDEVTRNQGGIIASRYGRLNARRKACEEINKMFGLNISVDYREDYKFDLESEKKLFEEIGNDGLLAGGEVENE